MEKLRQPEAIHCFGCSGLIGITDFQGKFIPVKLLEAKPGVFVCSRCGYEWDRTRLKEAS